jgi:flagellar biosynthesis/type III secretory pathway chaperone
MPPLRLTTTGAQVHAGAPQLALLNEMLAVLEAEFAALQASDAMALATTSAAKTRLLKALDPRAQAHLPAPERQKFGALLVQARASNLRNGGFVAAQHAYVRARWAGLASVAGNTGYYNAAGIARPPRNPHATLGHA